MKLIKYFILSTLLVWSIVVPKIFAASDNLISNPSVENIDPLNSANPLDWTTDNWGVNTTVFTYPVAGKDSPNAVKVEIKSRTSGDAKWAFKSVPVTPGLVYQYSDYYQSSIPSLLVAEFKLATNKYKYVDLGTPPKSATWAQSTAQVTAPAGAVSLTVYHLINKKGWLVTDVFSLSTSPVISPTPTFTPTPTLAIPTDTPLPSPLPTSTPTILLPTDTPLPTPTFTPTPTLLPPSPTPTLVIPTDTPIPTITPTIAPLPTSPPTDTSNLILNPSLENSTSGNIPDNWAIGNWGTNTAQFTYPVPGQSGDKAAKIDVTSYTDGDAKWYFDDVSVTPGGSYIFSDYYQSNVASSLVARYLSTTGVWRYVELARLPSSPNWSQFQTTVAIPTDVQSITVFHLINSVGYLVVDNYSLSKVPPPKVFAKGMVSLDFDDGWSSTFENGLPILDAAGFKSTQYIITGYMANAPGYVTAAQVLQMKNGGHDIESHSQTHPDLTTLSPSQLTTEVFGSRQDLINLGITPPVIAFPYGAYNSQVLSEVKKTGYSGSRTALIEDGGYNYQNQDPYLLKTMDVSSSTSLADIKSMIDTAANTKTWLILVMHSVAGDGTQYDTSPAKLQAIVDYLKTSPVDVVTVKQGLSLLTP